MRRRAFLSAAALACSEFDMPISYKPVIAVAPPPSPVFTVTKSNIMPSSVGPYAARTTNFNGYAMPIAYDPGNDVQYAVVIRNSNKILQTTKRTPGGAWSSQQATATPSAGSADPFDDHNNFNAAVAGNGKLLVIGGSHSLPINAWQAAAAGDYLVDTYKTLPLYPGNLAGESAWTYAYPMRVPSGSATPAGNILVPWRTGGSGNGTFLLYLYDHATDVWGAPNGNMFAAVDGPNTRSFYPHRPCLSPSTNPHPGRLHMGGTWRNNVGSDQSNENLYYVYSDPPYTTARAIDGTLMALPMVMSNMGAALVKTIPQGSGLLNNQAICVDDQDNPMLVQYWDVGGEGLYRDPPATNFRYQALFWDPVNLWTQVDVGPAVTRPDLVWKGGYAFCIYGGYAGAPYDGVGTWMRFARKSTAYDDWTAVQLDTTDYIASSPAHDHTMWLEQQKLSLLLGRSVYGGTVSVSGLDCLDVDINFA